MKKWLTILIPAILLVVLIVPFSFRQSDKVPVPFPLEAVLRIMNDPRHHNWLPGEWRNDSAFTFAGHELVGTHSSTTGYYIHSADVDGPIRLRIDALPVTADSCNLLVQSSFQLSRNPLKKIMQITEGLSWRKKHQQLGNSLKQFFSTTQQVYGFSIRLDKVKHSPHVSLMESYDKKPGPDTTYQLIQQLRTYVTSQQSRIIDSPIMHIVMEGPRYKMMVAVPTDRKLPGSGRIMLKEMVLGNILIADVKGGPNRIEQCRQQLENYARDFNKVSPAIPFERLITNRLAEKDSSKWISTINYPVFR